MMTHKKSGYILALTLAFIALFMLIASYLSSRATLFYSYANVMVAREKAFVLAMGGLQLAIAQLVVDAPQKEAAKDDKKQEGAWQRKLLKSILPTLNQAQRYQLVQGKEGVNGTISIAISSQEGKININKLFDFKAHKFIGEGKAEGDMKKMFQDVFVSIKEKTGADLFVDFEAFLKKRTYPLNDVSELLTIKSFSALKNNLFIDPFSVSKKETIYLDDLFTVMSARKEIEPWLFSESMKVLLKIPLDQKKNIEEILHNFKPQVSWKNEWEKTMMPLYGKEYASIPKSLASLLSESFSPKFFSVQSMAKVGRVSVRLLAILERKQPAEKNEDVVVHIRQVYLL